MEYVVTFPSTNQAILGENLLLNQEFTVQVMPLPATIKAGCGLCLRLQPDQFQDAHQVLLDGGVMIEGIYRRDRAKGIVLERMI